MDKIKQALLKKFDKHRIIFWYDSKRELRDEYEAIDLPDVEKIELNNNEFAMKYRILRQEPNQKFLLYNDGPQPPDLENWLLDVLLANDTFRTDQAALWLDELELGIEFLDIVQLHGDFFTSAKRREMLRKSLNKSDSTKSGIRTKMLAVCASADPYIEEILFSLLAELANESNDKIKLVERCNLDSFLWRQLNANYGYEFGTPSLLDFVIELFKSCYAMGTDGQIKLNADALVFLKRWKDSSKYRPDFELISDECAKNLDIEHDLADRDFRQIVDLDYFKLIDYKIIHELVKNVAERTIPYGECAKIVRQRRQSYWYPYLKHLYEAVDYAAQFFQIMDDVKLEIESFNNGIKLYAETWFKVDQIYRKFIFNVRKSAEMTLMQKLLEQVENFYSNKFLIKINENWQFIIESNDRWDTSSAKSQRNFYSMWVEPFIKKDNKVVVIISDGLRYEIGHELLGLIRKENKYEAKLEPALSMLPSYTQLSMAALLPNSEIAISTDNSSGVSVDGQSAAGIENRKKILAKGIKQRSTAIRANDLLKLNKDESRKLFKDHDVVYVYHNRIDATGDKKETEETVFETVEDALEELINIIKKLTNANASNLLVTSDHGFIYQNRAIDESDFLGTGATGEKIAYQDRRFVIGKGLKEQPGLLKFSASQLGLQGDVEIQIPKSIIRMRLSGSGSKYVHGGASLQEVVIPVIKINKKRESDISQVHVDILESQTSVITTGQFSVRLYQNKPVSDKIQPRILRLGFYTKDGKLISDSHELPFDLKSENARDREISVSFIFTRQADQIKGQEVFLRLEEQLPSTSHYSKYKEKGYVFRRSFTSDFDL